MTKTRNTKDFVGSQLLHDGKQDVRRANYAAFAHWYAALSNREYAPATVVFHGDSLTAGGFATTKAKTFTRIYTDAIQRMYRVGGRGWLPAFTYLPDIVTVGGTLLTTVGIGKVAYQMVGQSQTATYTVTGDRFWLIFTGLTTTGNAEVIIDGGNPITVATVKGDNSGQKVKYDSGTLPVTVTGTHTVVIRGAVGATVWLDGLFEFNADYGRGVQVWEIGHSGHTASEYADPAVDHYKAMAADLIDPDLVFIQFGLNDQSASVSKATYKANLAAIIANYRALSATPPSIALLGVWARADASFTDAGWQPYREAMRELSLEKGVAFFDMYDLGGWIGRTGAMSVDDLVINGTTTVTSATALFRPFDVGTSITGTGIPNGTTIATRVSDTQATLSASATTSGTITANFPSRGDPDLLTTDELHPSDRGHQWIADELMRLTSGMPKLATIPQGIFDAVGDLVVASGADQAVRFPLGTEGQALHVAAGSTYGLKYADPGIMGRILQYNANPGLATMTATGFGSAALITSATAATNSDQADGPYVRIGSSTLINTDGLITATTAPYAIIRPAWLPEFIAVIGTDAAITTSRIWAGLFSATPVASADPVVHGVGFRYDTVADGTAFWRCYSNDGTTTGKVTVTTVPIAVSSRYRLHIEARGVIGVNATEYRFYINDALVAIHLTELPGGTTNNLGPHVSVRALAAAAARFLLVSRISASYK